MDADEATAAADFSGATAQDRFLMMINERVGKMEMEIHGLRCLLADLCDFMYTSAVVANISIPRDACPVVDNDVIDKIVEAVQHKGFSVVEILDDCPTTYGRRNKFKSVIEMMNRLKEVTVPIKAAEKMSAEQLEGKIITGVLFKEERPHYTDEYAKVIARAKKA